jgi:pyruvate dehydrogenase E2 component (dihydrolipoamide acetyltransferase)
MAEEAKNDAPPKASEEKAPEPPKSVPEPPKSEPSSSPKPESTSKTDLPKGDRIFASPIAKKIALERGIPLGKINGSGPNGRIVREDVEKYKPEAAAAASSTAPLAAAPASADYVDTPTSSMRRTIAQRLTESKVTAPHYYLTSNINMDKVIKLREAFNTSFAQKSSPAKLSVNDFIVKAVAKACEDVPEANSAWLGETIRQYV